MPDEAARALSSPANPLLKAVRKAVARGRATDDGLLVAESPALIEEARGCGAEIAVVLLSEGASAAAAGAARRSGAPVRLVPARLFRELSATEHSQGAIALVRRPRWRLEAAFDGAGPVVVLDRIADPGNLGAIARSAEAFGAAGLLLTAGCASVENPKALRAAAGALFRLPAVGGLTEAAVVEACRAHGRGLLAASARAGRPIREVDFRRRAIVIGSEAHGVSDALAREAEAIHIPTRRVESLNAAVAAAVILYEAARD